MFLNLGSFFTSPTFDNVDMHYNLSLVMRKPAFCTCENKDADQLRGNREADQRLCFRYIASTILLLPKYEISSFWISSMAAQPGLCETWSESPKTGFLTTRLILFCICCCCAGWFIYILLPNIYGSATFKIHSLFHARRGKDNQKNKIQTQNNLQSIA